MNYKIKYDQSKLVLDVNQNYNKSIIDLDKWQFFLDILCGDRDYQKEAIKNSVIYLASGLYTTLEDLVGENYGNNIELQKKYSTLESYLSELQIKEKLFANIDLATGTGKSYVMYGIAQILLSEQVIKRVLVLCPSLTIESSLFEKFSELASNKELMHSIPETCKVVVPNIIDANSTISVGDICIENVHAVYNNTGSSIKDSFTNGGEDTLILNDESHHIFNKTSDLKLWKQFLINPNNNFKYILGFTGTAYLENEYFNDVIYRFSLRNAIDNKFVKSVEYVHKDDLNNGLNFKMQKIFQNHNEIKRKYSKIKPISIVVTKDIKSAKILVNQFVNYLSEFESIDKQIAESKVLIVTSSPEHKENLFKLKNVDSRESSVEWIISVSMLTEGWDVKNVFQIIPWEDKAFNSKLLISQVLGRGLRIPKEYVGTQPIVTVFNHDSWSKNIEGLVNEILEIETRIISTVKYSGERKKYNFKVKSIDYTKEEIENFNNASTQTLDYSNTWKNGINLKSQLTEIKRKTEYENLLTTKINTRDYTLKLKTTSVNDVLNKIFKEFSLRDWESKIMGIGDDNAVYSKQNLPPRDVIEKIIRKSMFNAGIDGNELIEENAQKIFTSFSTLFRKRKGTIQHSVISTQYIDLKTQDIRDESKGLSSFKAEETVFLPDNYYKEFISDEQENIFDQFLNDDSFPRSSSYNINHFYFKTPMNVVFTFGEPERIFIRDYLTEHDNLKNIDSWIKSRDVGFYSIEYSYKLGSHSKLGSFNPDFILKLKKDELGVQRFVIIEIKENKDDSIINKSKYKAATQHFHTLNDKLKKDGIQELYYFNFLSPDDYEIFFDYVNNNKIETFISGLDNLLKNNEE
jgi:type III restriction enzyme